MTGTLCRLIELKAARIGERPMKFRVEHGDNGGHLGTVMRGLRHPETPWEAWYVPNEDALFVEREWKLLGRYESPEAAALRLAAERFVPAVVEAVAV